MKYYGNVFRMYFSRNTQFLLLTSMDKRKNRLLKNLAFGEKLIEKR